MPPPRNTNKFESKWKLSQTFQYEGRDVRFGVMGEGPAVVVLHGTPWSSFNLRHIIIALAEHHTVYYYDMPGYGQSDKTAGDVSLGIQNQVLDQLLEFWELHEPIVIGHDFGGATALRTHLLNNRDFAKLVLIDPVAVSPWGSSFFRHVHQHEETFAGVPGYMHKAMVQAYIQTAAHQPLDEQTLKQTIQPWTGPKGQPAFYRQIAQADVTFTEEVEDLYPNISIPVLILWGEEDQWIPIKQGRKLHEMIPGSEFHAIADSGHLVIEEEPEKLVDCIYPFISG